MNAQKAGRTMQTETQNMMNGTSKRTTNLPQVGTIPTSEIIEVTPDLARRWLGQNTASNRKTAKGTIDVYARDMQLGRWKLTHQGIAFNRTGELIDGQHRLLAIVQAGVSVCMTVSRGFDVEFDSPIDQGRGRSIHAILHKSSKWVTMLRALHYMSDGAMNNMHMRLSLAEIGETQDAHGAHAERAHELCGSRLPGGVHAAVAWCLPLAEDVVSNFALQVKTGEMLERGDPSYALRTWLQNHKRVETRDHVYVSISAIRAAIEGNRLASVAPGPTAYRWSCGRRRALRIGSTPSPEQIASTSG